MQQLTAIYVILAGAGLLLALVGTVWYSSSVFPMFEENRRLTTQWLNNNVSRFAGDELISNDERVDLMRDYHTITPEQVVQYEQHVKRLTDSVQLAVDSGPGPMVIVGVFLALIFGMLYLIRLASYD